MNIFRFISSFVIETFNVAWKKKFKDLLKKNLGLPPSDSAFFTFDDSLLLLLDLSEAQPSGLLRLVDQPGVGCAASPARRAFAHQRRPAKHRHNFQHWL